MRITFSESVGAVLGVMAMGLVGYAVVAQHSDTALGLAGGVVTAAAGFFLRGKTQPPTTGGH